MAKTFELLKEIKLKPDECMIEIGSDRAEGSTSYLRALAGPLYTVDPHPTLATDYRMTGEQFLSEVFPAFNQKVRFAYLDGADWDYGNFDDPNYYPRQQQEYAQRGIELNNDYSQASHLAIVQLLEPFCADEAIILFDDTWKEASSFNGKGGTAVPWLVKQGFKVISSSINHVEVQR